MGKLQRQIAEILRDSTDFEGVSDVVRETMNREYCLKIAAEICDTVKASYMKVVEYHQ